MPVNQFIRPLHSYKIERRPQTTTQRRAPRNDKLEGDGGEKALSPSVEQLRPKSGRTMRAMSAKAGHSNILRSGGQRAGEAAQKFCSPSSAGFAAQWPCAQEAFLLT